ncbi:ABC transporter ATP-binding protein [Zavarzinia compransoris]|uniref:ABC transporter ATP-binding protein n=1 Tax=Zavarzinia compransoris TaxID=1264899 RepID=UPI0010EFAE2C|nr:ABC transporter ATP-binding protein [Zavarzinia compransoris]TDP48863.1 putative ABC transport system ATP-binding protein [Zavarzinia compransoris]
MQPTFARFLWRHTARSQFALLGIAFASFPFLWLYYEMPKEIVALIGGGMTGGFRVFGLALPAGLSLTTEGMLAGQCALLLLLVLINQRFRLAINRLRCLTAERALRRIRFEILSLVLRFPLHAFRQRTAGETMATMGGELDALSMHVGDAVAVPAYQGGTLVVILTFLFLQDPLMALGAMLLYPASMLIVPRLQRRVNALSRRRGILMRGFGERIDETFRLITDIHANGQVRWTRAWIGARLGEIFAIRLSIHGEKFAIKTVNTLVQQAGPILFYALGGILVLEGRLGIGTLVAVLAAHKDMAAPWRELLDWYQAREDAEVKYDTTLRLFNRPDLRPAPGAETEIPSLRGSSITVEDLTVRDEGEAILLDRVFLTVAAGRLTAIAGPTGSGREVLAQALAGLIEPAGGHIAVGGHRVADLSMQAAGRHLAYVGPGSGLHAGSIRSNLVFGLRRAPPAGAPTPAQDEAARAGNPADAADADWIDYAAAGVADRAGLDTRMIALLARLGFDDSLLRLGLQSSLTASQEPALAAGLIAARAALAERLAAGGDEALIARFDPERYNDHATLAENLLFGLPRDGTLVPERLADHPFIQDFLARAGLLDRLLEAGRRIAGVMVELFADLDPGHEMVRRFALVSAQELRRLKVIAGLGPVPPAKGDRQLLLNLPFRVVAARHRLNAIDDGLKAAVVAARQPLAAALPPALAAGISRFEPAAINPAASILDNVLYGRIALDRAGASTRVPQLAAQVLEDLDLGPAIRRLGLAFDVGIGGARLAPGERQRLILARTLLRGPDVIVLDDVLGTLDSACRSSVMDILREEAAAGACVVATVGDAGHAQGFDRVVTMERGRVMRPEEEL